MCNVARGAIVFCFAPLTSSVIFVVLPVEDRSYLLVEEADNKLFTNVTYNKQHVIHSTLPGTKDTKYHPITLSSPQRIARLLNVILLPGCFLKTFIDTMFFSLISYVFKFLFNTYRLLFAVILSRLTSCK